MQEMGILELGGPVFHGRGHRPFPHLWWQQLGLGHFQRGKPIRKRGALAAGATFLGTALYPRRFRDYSFGSSASDQAGASVDARRLWRRRRHPRLALAGLPGFCCESATNHAGAISCRGSGSSPAPRLSSLGAIQM